MPSNPGFEENKILQVFREIVVSRRSVRKFDTSPIPQAVLIDCVELALKAPNSSNLQPWDFHIVRSEAMRNQLTPACFGQSAARTAQAMIVVVARPDTWAKHAKELLEKWPQTPVPKIAEQYYGKLVPIYYGQGPLSLFGFLKRLTFTITGFFRPVPRFPFCHADMKLWATKSAALAAENLMLALRAHGYDSCPMEGFDEARVRKILKLKRKESIVMIVAAGKRADDGVYGPQFRFASERFIHFR